MFSRRPKRLPISDDASPSDVLMAMALRADRYNLTPQQVAAISDAAITINAWQTHVENADRRVGNARSVLVFWKSALPTELKMLADNAMQEIDEWLSSATESQASGREKLSGYFGLSYANFVCLPRVMLQAMPDIWQERFADLLTEYDMFWPKAPSSATNFTIRGTGEKGRLAKLDPVVTNYRRPDVDTLLKWQRQPINDFTQFADAVREVANRMAIQTGQHCNYSHDQITGAMRRLRVDEGRYDESWMTWENAEAVANELPLYPTAEPSAE